MTPCCAPVSVNPIPGDTDRPTKASILDVNGKLVVDGQALIIGSMGLVSGEWGPEFLRTARHSEAADVLIIPFEARLTFSGLSIAALDLRIQDHVELVRASRLI